MATDKESQGRRLKALIDKLNISQDAFAQRIGRTQGFIGQMISGRSRISGDAISRISDTYKNVNTNWLLTGEGEMFLPNPLDSILGIKSNGVSEQDVKYEAKTSDPLCALRELLDEHERRIGELEKQVRWLRGEDEDK